MTKPGPVPREYELLKLWRNRENIALPFKLILEEAKMLGFRKRTVINYLNKLVESKILDKDVDKMRNTYYRIINQAELTKALVKDSIDKMPLQITKDDLKLVVPKCEPWELPVLDENGKVIKKEKIESHYSASFESKIAKKWKKKLRLQIENYLKKRHPQIDKKALVFLTERISEQFFEYLEFTMNLNIFSNLKLKPIGASEWTTLSSLTGKVKKDLYAQVWQHLYDALLLLLLGIYGQCGSFEEFLKETKDTRLLLSLEADTNFARLVEFYESSEERLEEEVKILKRGLSHEHRFKFR